MSNYSPTIQKLAWNFCLSVRAALAALDDPTVDCGPALWNDSEEEELFCSIVQEIVNGLRKRTERVQ